MAPRIVAGLTPAKGPRITSGEKPEAGRKLTFSFEYWKQIPYFGMDRVEGDWFIGFLDRLKVISQFTPSEWMRESSRGEAWRCHPIDWQKKNIPIRKRDLVWVPAEIRDNEAEYEFVQFGLGAGHGRVVGVWLDSERFAIVLLDPAHNIQPAEKWGSKIQECNEQPSTAGLVHIAVDRARKELKCDPAHCSAHEVFATVSIRKDFGAEAAYHEVVSVEVDYADQSNLQDLLKGGHIKSVRDVLKKGIDVAQSEYLAALDAAAENMSG